MTYDYRKAVKADIRQWIADNEDYIRENSGESEDEVTTKIILGKTQARARMRLESS